MKTRPSRPRTAERPAINLDRPLLTRQQERELFNRLASLKSRADEMEARIERGEASAALKERVEALRSEAIETRNTIVEANLRLVVSVAARFASREVTLNELVSESLAPLMRAVELFDPSQGNNFSTYATHAVRNAIGRALHRRSRMRERMVATEPLRLDETPAQPAPETPARATRRSALASRALSLLAPRERTILAARYGLEGFTREHTFREIGGLLGLSKERARVLAHQSIEALQAQFGEDELEE
ncbi:MAG: sigma-70 family RNA polymerase sigma factor [Planctomycetaceae bacterium]|nr:sigma-70 family RNA polymerase sigma factor [Planctomycetaceae bacterium]